MDSFFQIIITSSLNSTITNNSGVATYNYSPVETGKFNIKTKINSTESETINLTVWEQIELTEEMFHINTWTDGHIYSKSPIINENKLKIESYGYIISSPLNIPDRQYILEFDVYHSIKCPTNNVIQYNMNDGTFRADEGIFIHNNCLIRDYYDTAPSQTLGSNLNSNQFKITFEIGSESIRVGYTDVDHNLISDWKYLIYSSKKIGLRVEAGYIEISNLRWRKRT